MSHCQCEYIPFRKSGRLHKLAGKKLARSSHVLLGLQIEEYPWTDSQGTCHIAIVPILDGMQPDTTTYLVIPEDVATLQAIGRHLLERARVLELVSNVKTSLSNEDYSPDDPVT